MSLLTLMALLSSCYTTTSETNSKPGFNTSGALFTSSYTSYVPLWTSSSQLVSSNIYQSAGGLIGINTAAPTSQLHVIGTTNFVGASSITGATTITGATSITGATTITGATSLVGNAVIKGPDPFVDVKAYGAVGDCATDDTAAIQSAITAITTAYGLDTHANGALFFPAGCYKLSSALTITTPMALIGASNDIDKGATLYQSAAGSDAIDFTTNANGSSIENLAIKAVGGSTAVGVSINVTGTNSAGLKQVSLHHTNISAFAKGILIQSAKSVHISKALLISNTTGNISITGGSDIMIDNSEIYGGSTYGLSMTGGSNLQLNNVQFHGNTVGIILSAISQVLANSVVVDASVSDGIQVTGSTEINFVNSFLSGNGTGHGAGLGYGMHLTNTSNFHWSGGFSRLNYRSGAIIDSGDSISFDHAGFSANGQSTAAGDTSGININTNTSTLSITNCKFGDLGQDTGNLSQTYGIYFNPGVTAVATNFVLQGNQDFNDTALVNAYSTNSYSNSVVLSGNATGVNWRAGNGTVIGACTQNGSLYSNLTGGAGTTLYVCVAGAWVNMQ